jgi:DNA-binding XRE family transcriptional regulator
VPIGLTRTRLPKTREQNKQKTAKIPACCWCQFRGRFVKFFAVVGNSKRKPLLRHRKIIGEAIRQYRKQAEFTQEELAEKSDLNPKYLGEVERGEKIISIEALLRIAKAVKVPAANFFSGL